MDMVSEMIDRKLNCSKMLGENNELIECISESKEYNLSIYIHCITRYQDDFYFKVFNDIRFAKATKCCRIKIFKSLYKNNQPDDTLPMLILNDEEKKEIVQMLNKQHWYSGKTVWNHMIKRFFDFSKNDKIKRKLKNIENKIPDYTKL